MSQDEPRLFKIARGLKTYKEDAKKYAKEHNVSERKAEFDVLDNLLDDLPDGAYFAAMAEQGFEVEDIVELSEVDDE